MKIPEPRRLASGNWNVQVVINGARKSITRPSRDECIRAAMLLKAGAKEAASVPAERKTIAEIIDDYIDSHAAVFAPNTVNAWRSFRNTRFQRLMPLRFSNVKNWQKMIADELRNVSPSSALVYWTKLKSAIKAAGLPVPRVDLKKPQAEPKPYLTPDQIPIFLDVIKGNKCETEMLLGLHGLRAGEICALRWQDIDLNRRVLNITGTLYHDSENGGWKRKNTTKTAGSRRTVPIMIPRLEELLASADKKRPPIRITPAALYAHINRVCRSAGLPEIGCHGLRRSFSSLAYSKNVPEHVLMILGGWTDITTVHRHYVQISQKDVYKYTDELRAFFK